MPTVRRAGSRVRRVTLGMSATDVEQKGIVTVYHKETCPYCKKVGNCICIGCVAENREPVPSYGQYADERKCVFGV